MLCIFLADRLHGSCKRTFLKPGLASERFKNTALAFSCGRRIRVLCILITSWPHPSTSSLWPLNPTMTHNNNNNNNNGGLHACVRAAEDIEPIRAKTFCCSATTLSRKRIVDDRLAIFVFFFLLCSVSPSTVCLYTSSVSSSLLLVNFKRHL